MDKKEVSTSQKPSTSLLGYSMYTLMLLMSTTLGLKVGNEDRGCCKEKVPKTGRNHFEKRFKRNVKADKRRKIFQ